MFFGKKKLLGLDIGSANLKLIELDVGRRGASLNHFLIRPTPRQAIVSGEIADPAAIADVVRAMVADLGSKRRAVAVGLWGTSVITKRITIPMMDEKLVGGQIRWEAEQYIPFDINEVNIDFKILKSFQSSPEVMDILLVAARQDIAMVYQDVVQSAGLECSTIDVCGFSLANSFLNSYGAKKGQTAVLLNIGAGVSNFVVVENGEVIFNRDIPVGGMNYSNDIAKAMSITFDEAEAMKISASAGQAIPDEVARTLQSTHETFAEEVQSSLDFFVNTTPGLTLQQAYLTGGGSRTAGLAAFLAAQTKLRFEPLDPFRGMSLNTKSLNPAYVAEIRDFASVAVGLGLRAPGDA